MANLSAPSLKKFLEHVANIFNITKYDGKWLRMEDKKLYKKQLEFNGRIGYTTGGAHPENFKWGGGGGGGVQKKTRSRTPKRIQKN